MSSVAHFRARVTAVLQAVLHQKMTFIFNFEFLLQ